MIGIASIYPSHHAHKQLEIKKHEKALINPQIKHIASSFKMGISTIWD